MTGLLRAVARAFAALADRAMATEVPPMLDRICPLCHTALDYNCREIAAVGDVQQVRCARCGTHSMWGLDGNLPFLIAHEQAERISA